LGSVWIHLFLTVRVPTLYFFNLTVLGFVIFVVLFVAFDGKCKFVLTSVSQIRQTLLILSQQTLNLRNQCIKSVVSFPSIVLVTWHKIAIMIKIISTWDYWQIRYTLLAVFRIILNLIIINTNLIICIDNLRFTSA
jgi:hypothetical protein